MREKLRYENQESGAAWPGSWKPNDPLGKEIVQLYLRAFFELLHFSRLSNGSPANTIQSFIKFAIFQSDRTRKTPLKTGPKSWTISKPAGFFEFGAARSCSKKPK